MAKSEAAKPLVELRDVRKSFGSHVVLADIDLAISAGEAVVVAGPSGSGKSTMLRCINGLEAVDSGEVLFAGERVDPSAKSITRMRADIGMVFQQFNLFPHMTVLENIALAPVKVKGVEPAAARTRAQERSRPSASRRSPRPPRRTCPAASSSASRSRVRWRWIPSSCCSTSRRRPSIRR